MYKSTRTSALPITHGNVKSRDCLLFPSFHKDSRKNGSHFDAVLYAGALYSLSAFVLSLHLLPVSIHLQVGSDDEYPILRCNIYYQSQVQ